MKKILAWLLEPFYFKTLLPWLGANGFILYGGGGKDSEAPDYGPVAQASEKSAEIAAELGRDQLAEAKRQYENNMAVAQPVIQAQLGLMNQQQAQGDDYFNYMKSYSRPVEQSLFYEAMGFTPDEIAQIETSRTSETNAFKQSQQANQQATTPTTVQVPTSSTQSVIPAGAVKGTGKQEIVGYNQLTGALAGYSPPTYGTLDPNKYYIKQADGSYKEVQAGTKTVEGTKSVTVDAQRGNDGTYSVMETPGTDALTAKLGAEASLRKKAEDAAARGEITRLNTDLATRIGESNVDVYNRNKADIDAETGQAVADVRGGYSSAQNMAIRQGLRYGMSPDRIAEAIDRNATTAATSLASAANTTRKSAVDTMYQRGVGESGQLLTGGTVDRNNKIQDEAIATAKKLDTAGLYRGLPGAAQGAYSLSVNAGNSAVQNTMQPGNQLLNANQGAASTILQGTQQQLSGLTGVLGNQTSVANANAGTDSAIFGGLGSVAGAWAGGGFKMPSDEDVKKDIKPMDDEKALIGVKGLTVKKWKYDGDKINGMDDKEHTGAMAQDMQKKLGDNVSDGKMVDVISALGVNMAATKALAKKVDKMEKKS